MAASMKQLLEELGPTWRAKVEPFLAQLEVFQEEETRLSTLLAQRQLELDALPAGAVSADTDPAERAQQIAYRQALDEIIAKIQQDLAAVRVDRQRVGQSVAQHQTAVRRTIERLADLDSQLVKLQEQRAKVHASLHE